MAYQPFDRKASGIVFFGSTPSDQVYESVSTFTYDTGNNSLKLPNGGYLGSQSYYNALSIASNGNVSLATNLSVGGNLTVNGTTTTVNSTVVTIEDPIIILGSGSPTTDDNKDRGVAFNWHNGSTAKTGWFGYDDSAGKFTFIPDATISSEVVSGTSGIIVATLEGNASTATALLNARNFSVTGNMTATGVSFDGTANVTLTGVIHPTAISDRTEITTVDGTGDYILIWDATDSLLKRVNRSNFVTGLGSMSSFTISDLGGGTQTINDGNTLAFAPGAAITFAVSATDTVSGTLSANVAGNGLSMSNQVLSVNVASGIQIANDTLRATAGSGISVDLNGIHVNPGSGLAVLTDGLHLDLNEYTDTTVGFDDAFLTLDSNNINEQLTTVQGLGSYFAGSGVSADGVGKINVGAGNGITVNATTVALATSVAGVGLSYTAGVLALDLNELSDTAVNFDDAFATLDSDNSTEQLTTVQSLGSYYAGSGLVADGVGILRVNTDNSTVEVSTDTVQVKDAGITEVKRSRTVASVSADATLSSDINLCTAGATGILVTMPAVATGKIVYVKKIDSGAGTVTVQRGGGSTIDGANTVILYHQYESIVLASNGTNWYIL